MYEYGNGRIVRISVIADVAELANKLRKSDVEEVLAAHSRTPTQALEGSFGNSRQCWSIVVHGEVIGMFGVGKTWHPKRGLVWFLASDKILFHSRKFLQEGRGWISGLASDYEVLYNHVDVRNTVSIRWLKWLGFDFIDRIPYGHQKIDFWLVAKFNNDIIRQRYIQLYKENKSDN